MRAISSVVRMRVREAGEVLAIDDAHLRTIVQTDSELSELFMRAYILRRVALITSQVERCNFARFHALGAVPCGCSSS